jgi:hypothetical protein
MDGVVPQVTIIMPLDLICAEVLLMDLSFLLTVPSSLLKETIMSSAIPLF